METQEPIEVMNYLIPKELIFCLSNCQIGPQGCPGNYQVRSLAGAGAQAYLEDGPHAARRLMAAKAALEQFDVVLAAGAHGLDQADERLLKEGLRPPKVAPFPFVGHSNFGETWHVMRRCDEKCDGLHWLAIFFWVV